MEARGLALRLLPFGRGGADPFGRSALDVEGGGNFGCTLSLGEEQLTQNWYGQGESDCLIKTKHCDGPKGF